MTLVWTWAQMEGVLAQAYGVGGSQRPAFTAKLRHLQRRGILLESNLGRGRATPYGVTEAAHFGFVLELLQLGLSPEGAATLFNQHREFLTEQLAHAALKVASGKLNSGESQWVSLDPRGLAYLQAEQSTKSVVSRCTSGSALPVPDHPAPGCVGHVACIDLLWLVSAIDAAAYAQGLTGPQQRALSEQLHRPVRRRG